MEKIRLILCGQYILKTKPINLLIRLLEVTEEHNDFGTWWILAKEYPPLIFTAERRTLITGIYVSVPEKMKQLRKAPIPVPDPNFNYPLTIEKTGTLTLLIPKKIVSIGGNEHGWV